MVKKHEFCGYFIAAVFFLWILAQAGRVFLNMDLVADYLSTANAWIGYGRIFFISMLFISYFDLFRQKVQYVIVFMLEYLVSFLMVIILCGQYAELSTGMVLEAALNILCFSTIPGILAVLIGQCISKIKSNWLSLISLIAVSGVFCLNIVQELLGLLPVDRTCYTIICRLFMIFNHSMMTTFTKPSYYQPFPVYAGTFFIQMFWILLWMSALLVRNKRKMTAAAGIVASLCFLILGLRDGNRFYTYISGYPLSTESKMLDSSNVDSYYYGGLDQLAPAEYVTFNKADSQPGGKYVIGKDNIPDDEFLESRKGEDVNPVSEYDIEINPGRITRCSATIHLQNTIEDEAVFTLYHLYKVEDVKDQDGRRLSYKQQGDYITVVLDGQVTELVFNYSGATYRCMAQASYTYLPGYFFYYPVSGKYNVYWIQSANYDKYNVLPQSEYHIKVNAGYEIFSNLKKVGDNEFAGTADNVSLFGGADLTTYEMDGRTFIYSRWHDINISELADRIPASFDAKLVIENPYQDSAYTDIYQKPGYMVISFDELNAERFEFAE